MKKTLLMAGALLAITAGAALAAGTISIAWDDCPEGNSILKPLVGLQNKNSTCTNTATRILIASFSSPDTLPHFNGEAGVVDIQTVDLLLPDWWKTYVGGCAARLGSVGGDFSFTTAPLNCLSDPTDPSSVIGCCNDIFGGAASGGLAVDPSGTGRLRIRTTSAVPTFRLLDPGTQNYIFRLTINQVASATGTTCTGCTKAACIVFNSLLITQPAGEGDRTITSGPRQYATWQGGVIGGAGCPVATPTQKSTWGSIKAMYR